MKKLVNKSLKAASLFFVIIFLFSTGCQQQTHEEETMTSSFDKEKAQSFVDSVNTKFEEGIRNGDSTELASFYSADAKLFFPNYETMQGRDITSGWGGVMRSGYNDYTYTTVDLTGDENFLIETGAYELRDQNKNLVDKGSYIVVYKKENAEWKIYRDISNSSMPASK